jgi:D-proline reductase (dithiol) PrdB
MDDATAETTETIEQLRTSFSYGSRGNLSFKYLKDLSDAEFGDFLEELFEAIATTTDDGDADRVIDVAYRWQVHGYAGHLGDPADFPHRHDDTPIATLAKPLSECRVALLTSSGHFVDGDDPEPFGEIGMTQAQAEARIIDFIRDAPTLSSIPVDTRPDQLRVRHGGYPIAAAAEDHQVVLPIGHLRAIADEGAIGELAPTAYSFVGATSQARLRKEFAPTWAEQFREDGVDAVLLVPV